MKTYIVTIFAALFTASAVHAATISIDGSAAEFADYSALSTGVTFEASSDTEGAETLTISTHPGGPTWSESRAGGTGDTNDFDDGQEINFQAGSTASTAAGAFTDLNYFTIDLTTSGTNFDWTSVGVTLWLNGGAAPNTFQFAYDSGSDGYDTGDLLGTASTVAVSGSAGFASQSTISYNASTIASDVGSAEVRLYYWGATAGGGNTHITEVASSLTAIPEPSTWALVAGAMTLLILSRGRRR